MHGSAMCTFNARGGGGGGNSTSGVRACAESVAGKDWPAMYCQAFAQLRPQRHHHKVARLSGIDPAVQSSRGVVFSHTIFVNATMVVLAATLQPCKGGSPRPQGARGGTRPSKAGRNWPQPERTNWEVAPECFPHSIAKLSEDVFLLEAIGLRVWPVSAEFLDDAPKLVK